MNKYQYYVNGNSVSRKEMMTALKKNAIKLFLLNILVTLESIQ